MKMKRCLIVLLALALVFNAPMAWASDLAITAASVVSSTSPTTTDGTAGATITAGQAVYLDSADSKYKLADCNLSSAAAQAVGIALHGAANGQPLKIQWGGNITIGGTVTVGTIYVLSGTAGGIAPMGDLTTGWRTTIVGVGTSATNISLRLYASDALVP